MFRRLFHFLLLLCAISVVLITVACFGETPKSDQLFSSKRSTADILQNGNFKLNSVDDLQQLLTYSDDRYPLISAHRGGASKGYPENAIETFRHVAKQMPVIIECDVRLSKDSVLVLMHDAIIDRTTSGHGNVNEHTVADLKKLNLKDTEGNTTAFRIPTLEEALLWGRGKVIYTLDIKKDVPYALLSAIVEKTNAKAYAVVITYNANQARALYNINPDLVISANINSSMDLRRHAEIGIPDNKLIAFVGTKQPDAELVDLLHRHGIKIILGTMGNLDNQAQSKGYQVYADYVVDGADILSTDYPLEAKKAIDFYIRKRNLTSPYINN